MKQNKALKYRFYPTESQQEMLAKTFKAYTDNRLSGGYPDDDFSLELYNEEASINEFILNKLIEHHGYSKLVAETYTDNSDISQ